MISVMSIEVFGMFSAYAGNLCLTVTRVCTRGDLLPNPSEDEVSCLFYSFSDSGGDAENRADYETGCIVVCPEEPLVDTRWIPGYQIEIVSTELDLLNALIDLVREWDPDILVGWQVQTASWGYIEARCQTIGVWNKSPNLLS